MKKKSVDVKKIPAKCSICSIPQSGCNKSWISCNLCLKWWHSACVRLSSSEFEELETDSDSFRFCVACAAKLNK